MVPISAEDLAKLVPEKTLDKAYDHALSGAFQEVGKFGTDAVKVARLILAPVQVLAAFQDRFASMMDRIAKRVPEERRVEPPVELVGEVIERIRYVDDKTELWKMFEEVLTKSVDCDNLTQIHPSFTTIISQLSRDEAVILLELRSKRFKVTDTLDWDGKFFKNRKVEMFEFPLSKLLLPDQINLYFSHLESLSLVTWPMTKQDPIRDASGTQTGVRRHSEMMLTDFGQLFAEACIPTSGF
jgi:hypothetical protein